MSTKKSILIYFDNYPMLEALPPEQRGWLLSALMVYGDRLSQDGSVTLEEVLEQFPQLTPEARVACGFMGSSILRDTRKWLNRQRRGNAKPTRSPQGPPVPAPPSEETVRRDMERTQRLMELFREQKKQDA